MKYVAREVCGRYPGKILIVENAKDIDDACKLFHSEETIKTYEEFKSIPGSIPSGRIYEVHPLIDDMYDYREERFIRTSFYG